MTKLIILYDYFFNEKYLHLQLYNFEFKNFFQFINYTSVNIYNPSHYQILNKKNKNYLISNFCIQYLCVISKSVK